MMSESEKDIENEFSCQYLPGELPPFTERFVDSELPRRASDSAARLYGQAKCARASETIALLRAMSKSKEHHLTRRISDDMIDWTEDENWPILVLLLNLIADGMERKLQGDDKDRQRLPQERAAATPSSSFAAQALSAATRAPAMVYQSGTEHAPTDPFGATVLSIYEDGRVELDNRRRGQRRRWRGRIDASNLAELHRTLSEAGFPVVPKHPVPAGSALRKLTVRSPGGEQSILVAWHAADSIPGYKDVFQLLDSVVRQTSQDAIKATPDYIPGLVHDTSAVQSP